MNVLELMTRAPATTERDTPIQEVARLMVDHNCGAIPVVDEMGTPIGVVTDRDIVCRTVALGENPLEKLAKDVMTHDVVTVKQDSSMEHLAQMLEEHQIRRVVVVDDNNHVIGIVAQADLARHSETTGGEVVAAVSEPSLGPSAIH